VIRSEAVRTTTGKFSPATFEQRPVLLPETNSGHPEYSMEDFMISIVARSSGDPELKPRPWKSVQGDERQHFLAQYEAWKRGEELPSEGMPLAAWVGMEKHLLEPLKRNAIRTVEDLAAMAQAVVQSIGPGCLALQAKAQRFLEDSKGDGLAALSAKNADLTQRLKAANEKIDSLLARCKELEADRQSVMVTAVPEAPRRPGRPPKAA
jgi:hypothetical protein